MTEKEFDLPLIECAICSVPFEIFSNCFADCGIEVDKMEFPESDAFIPFEELEGMDDETMEELGLTEEMKSRLLKGESVETGVMAICKNCQDKIEEEWD